MYGFKKETKEKCGPLKFNRIRVYFRLFVFNSEGEFLFESFEVTPKQGEKLFKRLLELFPKDHIRLNRIQTGGTIGGIVLSGRAETILKHN